MTSATARPTRVKAAQVRGLTRSPRRSVASCHPSSRVHPIARLPGVTDGCDQILAGRRLRPIVRRRTVELAAPAGTRVGTTPDIAGAATAGMSNNGTADTSGTTTAGPPGDPPIESGGARGTISKPAWLNTSIACRSAASNISKSVSASNRLFVWHVPQPTSPLTHSTQWVTVASPPSVEAHPPRNAHPPRTNY